MCYTLLYGEDKSFVVSFDKKGSTYSVSVWNRSKGRFDLFEDFNSKAYDAAKERFLELCQVYKLNPQETNLDTSSFANID